MEISSCRPPPLPHPQPSIHSSSSRASANAELLVVTPLVASLPRPRLVRKRGSGCNWPSATLEISGCIKFGHCAEGSLLRDEISALELADVSEGRRRPSLFV